MMDKQGTRITTDQISAEIVPKMVDTIEVRARRTARVRVANVLRRLRRRNGSNAEKTLDRLDEDNSECQSEVSGITDTFYGDDFSLENGVATMKKRRVQRTHPKGPRLPSSISPSSMPLVTSITDSPDCTLSDFLGSWLDSLSSLSKSKEMNTFLHCSNRLATSAAQTSLDTAKNVGGIVVYTALLPVTLPLHVTASATDIVFNKGSDVLHYFCDNLAPIVVNQAVKLPKNPLLTHTSSPVSKGKKGSKSTSSQINTSQECFDGDEFLDRFRLDLRTSTTKEVKGGVCYSNVSVGNSSEAVYSIDTDSLAMKLKLSGAANTTFSIRLLRVEDINVMLIPELASYSKVRVLCVDLHEDFSEEKLTIDALTRLAQRAMDIALSNEGVLDMLSIANRVENIQVEWKPLGQTKKDYKRLVELSKNEFYDELCSRVLTWSGKYLGEKYHGSENPFFMSRGIVNGSPLEVLNLLWESKRTKEYNKHCVKREDKFIIFEEDKMGGSNGFYGAKIIESETKVPMTKISVRLSALLCAKPLGKNPDDGFVIFSRSLSCGTAGYHSSETNGILQSGSNEVILGINIVRPVSGRPGWSDLISISQVDASILPPFLKSRVGIMAVEDFFKNARNALRSPGARQ